MKNVEIPEIIKVLNECIVELNISLEEYGGCDHSVGICTCKLQEAIDEAQILTARLLGYEVVPKEFEGWEIRGIPSKE